MANCSWAFTLRQGSSDSFSKRLEQLRSGDGDAIRDFVAKYEPYIRRTIRFRITRASLRPAADSVDVCQSVMGSFLLRLSAGDYQLHSEDDLRSLLLAIANKKFLMLSRRESAARRARDHTQSLSDLPEPEARDNDPASPLECEELLNEVHKRLSTQERELYARRRKGDAWSAIASDLSEDAAMLRKRLSRAMQRVASELGLEY